MKTVIRFALAFVALGMLAAGAAFAVVPQVVARDFAIASTGVAGFGTLRADMGGLFLVMGAFTLAALREGHSRWLAVPTALIGAFLALRVMHLAVDGVSDAGLRSTVVEFVLLILLLSARRVLRPSR